VVQDRPHRNDSPDSGHPLSAREKDEVCQALDELLHSQPLRSTTQCQQLLRYIVEHTLSGELVLLRERVIGKEVFGRRADYEPGEDPVVRIRAADLRKRLALYYQTHPEPTRVRIDVPSGSYRATFAWRQDEPVAAPSAGLSEATSLTPALVDLPPVPRLPMSSLSGISNGPQTTESTAGWSRLFHSWWVLAALLLVASAALTGWYMYRASDPVRAFWEPMLTDPKVLLISIGSNAVYRVGEQEIDQYLSRTGGGYPDEGMEFYPPLRPDQTLASTGISPAPDSFVSLADVAATTEIVKMLSRYGKNFDERFPNDISYSEIREHPTISIGGANNPVTKDLTKNLPYVRKGRNVILDRAHPENAWELHASADLHDTDDYAIITSLIAKDDADGVVSVAGLGGHGTLAAAEFLCRADTLRSLRARLGRNWRKKNFQVVLHIKIIDFKPSSMEIVAAQQW
jgi:hypothetical protein